MRRDRSFLILGGVAAMLVLLAGTVWLSRRPADPLAPCRTPIAAAQVAGLGAAFLLTDQDGQRVSDRQVLAGPALLYFGYTFCPDVCPLDAARNAEATALLEAAGIRVTPVFVSVDPGRDTPEALRLFAGAMHPRMIALTGSRAEIDAVARGWQSYYRLDAPDAAGNYMVEHMTNTFLVLPGLGTVAAFPRDLPAPDLARQAACLVQAAGRRGI